MSEQYSDPRSIRTKKAILQTFKEMLTEMELPQITIKKLTERVGINRKTFYHHYNHIEDLILDMQDQLILTSIEYFKSTMENKDFRTHIRDNFLFWTKEIDFIHTFYSRKDLVDIYNDFSAKESMMIDFKKIWPELKHPELVQAYSFGATNYLLSYWYTHDKPISVEEFAEIAADLITNGFQGMIKDNE